jgi:hypothetical protein
MHGFGGVLRSCGVGRCYYSRVINVCIMVALAFNQSLLYATQFQSATPSTQNIGTHEASCNTHNALKSRCKTRVSKGKCSPGSKGFNTSCSAHIRDPTFS